MTRVCLSVHRRGQSADSAGGVSPAGGGGQSSWGGVSPAGGGVSPAGGWGWVSQPGGSVQPGGVSWGGSVSQGGSAGGGRLVSQDRTTECVLTTQRAVCLLRSRRRTFLFLVDLVVFLLALLESA